MDNAPSDIHFFFNNNCLGIHTEMSSLEKLSEEGEDPLSIIHHLLHEEPDPSVYRLLLNGIDGAGIVRDWTPSMLLWNRSNSVNKKEALKLLLFHGIDMNVTGALGLNSLHLLVLRLAYSCEDEEEERMQEVEWWMRMGADPTAKLFLPKSDHILEILTPVEFFILLCQDLKFVLKSFPRKNPRRIVSEKCQRSFFYTMLCFDAEAPTTPYHENVIYLRCAALRLRDITDTMLRDHKLLRQRLCDHYKLSVNQEEQLEERHYTLRKKFNQCYPPSCEELSAFSTVIHTASWEYDGYTPIEKYFSVTIENGNQVYFHAEMISRLLRDNRNPCTNMPFSSPTRWEWIHKLENGPICFPYHSLEENKTLFPKFFHIPEKPYKTHMLLEKLNDLMSRAHPFSNVLLLQNYEDYQLSYLCSILEGDTYCFKEAKEAENLQELLTAMILWVYADHDKLATIHFAIEEVHEDLLLYHAVCTYFEKNKMAFIFSFYEAISHLEIFRLISVRVGYASIMEMALIWYKMSSIYTFHHSDGGGAILVIHEEDDTEEVEFKEESLR